MYVCERECVCFAAAIRLTRNGISNLFKPTVSGKALGYSFPREPSGPVASSSTAASRESGEYILLRLLLLLLLLLCFLFLCVGVSREGRTERKLPPLFLNRSSVLYRFTLPAKQNKTSVIYESSRCSSYFRHYFLFLLLLLFFKKERRQVLFSSLSLSLSLFCFCLFSFFFFLPPPRAASECDNAEPLPGTFPP